MTMICNNVKLTATDETFLYGIVGFSDGKQFFFSYEFERDIYSMWRMKYSTTEVGKHRKVYVTAAVYEEAARQTINFFQLAFDRNKLKGMELV